MKWILALAMFSLGGCASKTAYVDGDQAPGAIKKQFRRLPTPAACREAKGNWMSVQNPKVFPGGGYCMLKTRDGGKRCHASGECEGYCELSVSDFQDSSQPRCSSFAPPRWDRCVPGYFESGKVLGRGECFGEDSEIQ